MDEVGILAFLSLLLPISVAHSISFHWDTERRASIPDLREETRRCCYSCMLSGPSPWGSRHGSTAGSGGLGTGQQITEQPLHLVKRRGREPAGRKRLRRRQETNYQMVRKREQLLKKDNLDKVHSDGLTNGRKLKDFKRLKSLKDTTLVI